MGIEDVLRLNQLRMRDDQKYKKDTCFSDTAIGNLHKKCYICGQRKSTNEQPHLPCANLPECKYAICWNCLFGSKTSWDDRAEHQKAYSSGDSVFYPHCTSTFQENSSCNKVTKIKRRRKTPLSNSEE